MMTVTSRPATAGVFRHEVAGGVATSHRVIARHAAEFRSGDFGRDREPDRRSTEARRRAPASMTSPTVSTRSPEDLVEEYERWDGMA